MVRGQQFFVQIVGDRTLEERTLRILVLVLVVGGGSRCCSRPASARRTPTVPWSRSASRWPTSARRFDGSASSPPTHRHELRTPLTVIRASVEDLERHPRQAGRRRSAAR